MRRRLLALPLGLLLLLSGCASSPEAEVRQDVRDVLAAANDQDADAVRAAVEDLLSTLREQVGSSELTEQQATPVREAALAIRDSVAELEEVEPTPTPTPEESESPTPSPTPTPTPTPEPTEEPEETEPPETEDPEPTEEPQPEPTEAPEDDGDDQATVVPQLPEPTRTPTPAPTAS